MRAKMDMASRAKQFMPFDALKGFREALKERERIVVPKIELSEDDKEVLDRKMGQVQKKDLLTVVYFQDGEYVQVTGMVSRLDMTAKVIKIVNTKINLEDILDLQWPE